MPPGKKKLEEVKNIDPDSLDPGEIGPEMTDEELKRFKDLA